METTPDIILVRIKRILAELTALPAAEINSQDSVEDILAADSLSLVEYQTALEITFGVELPDTDPNLMSTLDSTAIYISKVLTTPR